MSGRSAATALCLCVVLLMFGTSGVAEDDFVFDLSDPPEETLPLQADAPVEIEDLLIQPTTYVDAPPAETPTDATPKVEPSKVEPKVEPSRIDPPLMEIPAGKIPLGEVPLQEGLILEHPCPDCGPYPADEGGWLDWRPRFPQFDLPSRSFSLFRSPASYGWGYQERCAPTPWKPRGNGIPKRNSRYRMDYAPYELESNASHHGPAFYMRYELYPCEECHHHGKHLKEYYGIPRHSRRRTCE